MRRSFQLAAFLFFVGLICLAQQPRAQLTMTGVGGGFGAGGGGGYTAQGVKFDGTTYLSRGAALTGNAPSKVGIVSYWIQMLGGDGTFQFIGEDNTGGGSGLQILRLTDNTWRTIGSPGSALSADTATTFVNGGSWSNILLAWDVSSSTVQLYVNDVSEGTLSSNNVNISYSSTDYFIGARSGGSFILNANIADLYINVAQTLDMSITGNRRKFISGTGHPVDLGSDGSTPTGTAPIMYFSGAVGSWQTNKGTGGGFTVQAGALTAAATNP